MVVIDDGSTDSTAVEARVAGATTLTHTHNLGVGAAIRTGVKYALNTQADIVIIMAGDGQSDTNDIMSLIIPIVKNGKQFVQGSRFLGDTSTMPLFRRAGNSLLTLIFRVLVRARVTDFTSGFRAFTKEGLSRIMIPRNVFNRYEMEPWILAQAVSFLRWQETPIQCIYGKDTSKMKPIIDWLRFVPPILIFVVAKKKITPHSI